MSKIEFEYCTHIPCMVLKQGTKHKEKGNDLKRFGTCFKYTREHVARRKRSGNNYKRGDRATPM